MKKRDGTSPKIIRRSSSPKTTRRSSSPKTTRRSSSPKTTRRSLSPKTTRKSSPKITRKSPKSLVTIVLKNYIENIKLYNDFTFIDTLSSFKIYKLNKKKNEIYDFISQLFNFDRYSYKFIYINKNTILEYIIVSGLYTEFELLLNDLNEISENKVNCDERNIILFDRKKSAHLKNINIEENKKINNFIDELILKIQEYKINLEIKKIKNDLKKFLFYCVCIKPVTRQYILRHYLLSFIKSASFKNYSNIILDDVAEPIEEDVEFNEEQEYINNFLIKIGNYRTIPAHDTIYNNKIITTCAESTILNLLNYFYIDKNSDEGKFIIKDSYSNKLLKFYKKYDSMYKQYIDTKKTLSDWVQFVNNIDEVIYGQHGDISSIPENIIMVLNKILNRNYDNIPDILNDINKNNVHNINVIIERKDSFQAIIDNLIKITFYKSHSIFELFCDIINNITFDDDDCRLIYNIIKEKQLSDDELEKEIVSDYLETKTEIKISDIYNLSLLNKTTNLTKLTINFNQPLKENSLDSLTNLKHLTFYKYFDQPLKNSLDNLKNLEYLTINKKYENEILCRILNGELQKLKILYLNEKYTENIIPINIDEYLLGEPPEFCTVLD
jgi:hypothetical protein